MKSIAHARAASPFSRESTAHAQADLHKMNVILCDHGYQKGTKSFKSSKRSKEARNCASMSDTPTSDTPT